MLSLPQREAIRHWADHPDTPRPDWLRRATVRALIRRSMLTWRAELDGGPLGRETQYRLTSIGEREHARIMRSGDGPEALKELLRF